MRLRHLFLLGLALAGPVSAGAQSVDLPVPYERQLTNEWCWAASTQMVLEYLHKQVPQCTIVEQAYGMFPGSCCMSPACSNWPGSIYQVQNILYANGGGLSSIVPKVAPNYLYQELRQGRPVIAHVNLWGTGPGHFAVIRGMTYYAGTPFVIVNDPYFGYMQVPWNSFWGSWDASVMPW
jgi:hypothetical protein